MGVRIKQFVLPIIFLLFVSLINVQAQIDESKIGVKDGDTFKITVMEASGEFSGLYSTGEEIDVEVIDAVPDSQDRINIALNRGNGPIENSLVELDEFGSMIVYTDWDYWSQYYHDSLLSQYDGDYNVQLDSASSSIGDFGFIFETDFEINFSTGYIRGIVNYHLTTGIIMNYFIELNFSELDGTVHTGVFSYSNSNIPGPDTSKIGVNVGDVFEFELLAFPVPDQDYTDYEDSEYKPPQVGDKISFEVINIDLNEFNEIMVQQTDFDGETDTFEAELDSFGSPIIFTDWEFWEANAEFYNGFFSPFDQDNSETTLTNSGSVFEISTTFDMIEESYSVTGFDKISYDKATGVMNEIHTSQIVKDLESGEIEEFEIHFRRVDFLGETAGGLADVLPGFEVRIITFSLLFVLIPIQKLRKNRIFDS